MVTIPRILNFPEAALLYGQPSNPMPFFPDLLSTRTFLNSFEAGPSTGTIHFPAIELLDGDREGQRVPAVAQVALAPTMAPRLIHAAFMTVLDGGRLWKEREGKVHPLLATRGEWILEGYEDGMIPYDLSDWRFNDGKEVGRTLGKIDLSSFGGKKVEMDLLQGDLGVDVGVGHESLEASVLQSVFVNREGEVQTNGYFFYFGPEALLGLRALLDCSGSSIEELALRAADRIHASGQYAPDVWFGRSIRMQNKDIEVASDASSFPTVSVIATEGGGEESLSVSLNRPRGTRARLMPLSASLRRLFWDLGKGYAS